LDINNNDDNNDTNPVSGHEEVSKSEVHAAIPLEDSSEGLSSSSTQTNIPKDSGSSELPNLESIIENDSISANSEVVRSNPESFTNPTTVPEIVFDEDEGSSKVSKFDDGSTSANSEVMSSRTTPEGSSSQTTEQSHVETPSQSPRSSSSSKQFPVHRRKNRRNLNSNKNLTNRNLDKCRYGDWKVGDKVIAMWISDGVWRKGIIHEMFGDEVFVIATEDVAVKATKVKKEDLKSISIPIEFLNMVEDQNEEKRVGVKMYGGSNYKYQDDQSQMMNINSMMSFVNCDELFEDSSLEVLTDLLPCMDKSRLETLASLACKDIYKFCTFSSKSYLFLTTLVQFSSDQRRNEIMNEIVDKAELLLRTDTGYSSLLDLVSSADTNMSLISSWICDNLLDISCSGNQRHAEFCVDVFSRMDELGGETQIEVITRFILRHKLLVQLARTSVGSFLLQKLIRIVVSRQGSLKNDVLQVLSTHVQVLCRNPNGVRVLKCLDGFI